MIIYINKLTRWCHPSLLQSDYHPQNGNRTDNLQTETTAPSTERNHAKKHLKRFLVLTRVSCQLPADSHVPLAGLQIVDGADVIQTSAGHVVSRRSVCAGHDPRGTQWDGMYL